MRRLLDCILISLALALLHQALSPELRTALPIIGRRLQGELPFWRQENLGPLALEKRLAQLVSDAIRRSPRRHELLLVRLLVDPLGLSIPSRLG